MTDIVNIRANRSRGVFSGDLQVHETVNIYPNLLIINA